MGPFGAEEESKSRIFSQPAAMAGVGRRLEVLLEDLQGVLLDEFFQRDTAPFKAKAIALVAGLCEILRGMYPPTGHRTLAGKNSTDSQAPSLRDFDWERLDLQEMTQKILGLRELAWTDIEAALANDPATDDPLEVMFCYPGFLAVLMQRLAHLMWSYQIPLLPRLITSRAQQKTGIDIHPGAKIGSHFFIDHGTGVVIGESTEIGNHVTLYQGVTLGAKKIPRDDFGTALKHVPRHPILGDNVTVYSGATILGRIHIGEGSVIGGNIWLTESVAPMSRITQQRFVTQCFTDGDGI